MIHSVDDLTGYWFVCDACGKTRTYNIVWQREEAVRKHTCIATATLIPNAR
jgi:hypothetical protein